MLPKGKHCSGCVLEQLGQGFMAPSGTGKNGVLLVAEALGEQEAIEGFPFAGKAGFTLEKILKRGGLDRDDFKIANTVWCRPPKNKLSGEWYQQDAINQCSPYLDAVIRDMSPRCIVALGAVAARRLVPTLPVGVVEARGYTFWSEEYNTWIVVTVHPSFIMRGKTAWAQVLLYDIQHAVEIARDGYAYSEPDYTLDPPPSEALRWVEDFETYHQQNSDLYLSCDIETPEKDADEEGLDLEDGSDYLIQRCGYSYRDGHALSIPWDGPYRIIHNRLLGTACQKVFWNAPFDTPRIRANGISIGGDVHDAMDAWHVLNSDLKKSLGFVAPFFAKRQKMWKHLSSSEPAYYNAVDADVAGINMRGTVELLKKNNLWKVYNEFICELDPVYAAMSRAGMPVDLERRIESSKQLIAKRDGVRQRIQEIIPDAIKPYSPKNGYVRTPASTDGLVERTFDGVTVKYCPNCGERDPKKPHFKAYKKRQNPCAGFSVAERVEGTKRWVKMEPFVPSTKGIMRYQEYMKHPLIFTGRGDDRKATTDEKAIRNLIGKHIEDPFYPLVLDDREYTKVGGTYIGWFNPETGQIEGGFPVGRDGRVHGTFRHTPSTLRSSMVSPNLQNLPRGDDSEVQKWVKGMFVAPAGWTFVARDFKGIEAQLVGHNAGSKDYLRLAKIDVHSYFTAYNLYRVGKITTADLPDLKWSDADLKGCLKQIKKRFEVERNIGKRCIHAGNYRVGASKLHEEYPQWFPKIKDAAAVLAFYYEVFPEINAWHERLCKLVDRSAIIKNSFGHAHRFYQVLEWTKRGSKWEWTYGDDAKRLIAFGPQSDAAFIGKRALKRLYYNYPETVARWLRLFIHDEIFTECPKDRADEVDSILQFEMEQPIRELPLDPTWGFGSFLAIESEAKRGDCWEGMH